MRHLISECILKHFNWQMRSPQRGQLDLERLPQMEQYLREGYLGLPTLILQKLGSVFYYSPYSWMIFLRFRFLFRCPSFFALLFTLFSFLCFLGYPSPTSKPSSSSSYAILLGSSKKSYSRYLNFYSITARRLFSSTFLTAAEKRLLRPP